jgi:hypothetical protein
MATYSDGIFSGSADFLVERFGKGPNIEDVITEVQSLIECNGKDRVQHFNLVSARQHLFDGLRLWFR